LCASKYAVRTRIRMHFIRPAMGVLIGLLHFAFLAQTSLQQERSMETTSYIGKLEAVISHLSRQILQKFQPNWTDLLNVLLELMSTESASSSRSIFSSTSWCSQSALFCGITQFIANSLVDIAKKKSIASASFQEIFWILTDVLVKPCEQHKCKWRKKPKWNNGCPAKWNAISHAIQDLMLYSPDYFSRLIPRVDLKALISSQTQCAFITINGLFGMLQEECISCCYHVAQLVINALLEVERTDELSSLYREELLLRMFKLVQNLPFRASPCVVHEVFKAVKDCMLGNIALRRFSDGFIVFVQMMCSLSEDFVYDVSSDCYDLIANHLANNHRVDSTVLSFARFPYLLFLMGFSKYSP
jgi:hypothetical protein